ncbi:hypothetical protein ACEPAF_50 [Sanghuangporus sanghuang]
MKTSTRARVHPTSIAATILCTLLASCVGAVCPSGNIGVGDVIEPFFILGARAERGVIVGNDCSIIDGKSDINDASICGTYADGSTVTCNDGTNTPTSVHTSDGQNWGNCVPSTETCTNGNGGTLNGNITVQFCCTTEA